jgi:probable HAF family extracellular repeat protein
MKIGIGKYVALMSLLPALTVAVIEIRAAQEQPPQDQLPHYRIVNLGTLGGTSSSGNTINNVGVAMGTANLTGDIAGHATIWAFGIKQDLGTLGGETVNSTVAWPNRNNHGEVAGISETSNIDPLGERFSCPVFFPLTGRSCVAFMWEQGLITALPSLGGNNSVGAGINNRGQIVGWAENAVHDGTCDPPQVLQFEAVIWGPRMGQIQQLPPYPGDLDTAATAINNLGQVVGISGICGDAIGAYSAKHAVLWENGNAMDLGNIGGAGWNTPTVINNRGQIAGFADVAGDVTDGVLSPNFKAFLWTKETGMINLHTLSGDAISEVTGMNDVGQLVGVSFAAGFSSPRAFFWQNNLMTDLNSLIPANSSLYMVSTGDINDRGEITGQACVVANGTCTSELTAVLLIPVLDGDSSEAGAAAENNRDNSAPRVDMPENVRVEVLRRLGLGGIAAHSSGSH